MKIVAVSGFAWEPKGTGRARAFPMLVELVRRGHSATLLTVPYDNRPLADSQFTRENVTVRGLALDPQPMCLLTAPWRAVHEIEAAKPDVVHIFKPKGYAGAIASLLLRRKRVPVCTDLDDWEGWGGWNDVKPYPWIVKEYIDRQERSLTLRSDSVTVASRVLERRALATGQLAERIFYAPNCLTASQFARLGEVAATDPAAAKVRLGLAPDRPTILYAGHFEPADDVLFLCRAALPALDAGATLLLIGSGQELPAVREFFATSAGDVHYLGQLDYEQYLEALTAADIACFPYPDTPVYRAKCSARIIDYMGSGRAVVTTNVGQNPEYIVDRESGLLCQPNDAPAFADRLLCLMRDSDLRHSLGAAARSRIGLHFLWEREAAQNCEAAYVEARRTSFAQRGRA